MIVCNGIVGLCLVVGGLRHGVLAFRVEGTSPALASLAALSGLALVLPSFTTTTSGPTYSGSQLAIAGITGMNQLKERLVEVGRNFDGKLFQERITIKTRRVPGDVAVRAGNGHGHAGRIHESKVPGVGHPMQVRCGQIAGDPLGMKSRHQETIELCLVDHGRRLDRGERFGGERHTRRGHRNDRPNALVLE